MDCEKFEANLIDELYEELDELTSAAVKRHVAGCSRCASILGGLRATRRVAVLPVVEPSLELEDRILAAARSAQKVVPIRRRFSRAVSLAGAWAMRPQTAMAAVFVLMVGSSLLFVRRGKFAANDSVTVTAQGRPEPGAAPFATTELPPSVDSSAAAAAHGAPQAAAAPAPLASAASPAGPAGTAAPAEDSLGYAGYAGGKERSYLPKAARVSSALDDESRRGGLDVVNAPPAHASRPIPMKNDGPIPSDLDKVAQNAPPAAQNAWGGDLKGASGGGASQAPQSTAQNSTQNPNNQRANNSSAELQAANSTRDSGGCGAAVDQYNRIAQQNRGTTDGNAAEWAAAECYRALQNNESALAHYQRLITIKGYDSMAQQRINLLTSNQNQVATRAVKKAAAPAKPAAPNATTPAQSTPQQAPPHQAAPTSPTQAY